MVAVEPGEGRPDFLKLASLEPVKPGGFLGEAGVVPEVDLDPAVFVL